VPRDSRSPAGRSGGVILRPKRVSRPRGWLLRVERRIPFSLGIHYAWWLRRVVWVISATAGALVLGWVGALLFLLLAEVVLFAISLANGRHLRR
jgi:hypothetical protein